MKIRRKLRMGMKNLSFLIEEKNNLQNFIGSACPAGNSGVYIEYNGDVFPCPYLRIKSLGNIKYETFESIWKRWKRSKLFSLLKNYKLLKSKCKLCKYNKYCNGGCRALSFYTTGSIFNPDPLCFL